MKIAVGLFGIHYAETMQHWKHYFQTVDYRLTYKSQQDCLYKAFENSQCDFYSSTYFSPILPQLIKDFNFTGLRLQQLDNTLALTGPLFYRRNRIFKQTLKLIADQPKIYDYVLITRYDLKFRKKLNTLNIDFTKLNLAGTPDWIPNVETCDDNFYFMPFNYLKKFIKIVESIPENTSAHSWLRYYDDYHFILPGYYTGPFPRELYGVVRHKVEGIPMPV